MGYRGKGGNPLAYMGIDLDMPTVTVQSSNPTTSNKEFDPGDMWVNKSAKRIFFFASGVGGVGTWIEGSGDSASIDSDFISGVLAKVAIGAAVATEGNRYIADATGGGWTENLIYTYENAAWVELTPTEGALAYNNDTNAFTYYTGSVWAALASGVTTLAGLTDTNITAPSGAQMLIWDNSNSWDNKTISGDVAITTGGVTTVIDLTFGSDARGDIAIRGATDWDRVSAKGDKYIMIGNGTDFASKEWTGDVALTNLGVSTVTDFTLSSEAQGTINYFNGSNWVILAVGSAGQALISGGAASNVIWGTPTVAAASALTNTVTCEAGATDYTLDFGTSGGAYTLTVPAVAGSRTFAFINEAQSITADQTFGQTNLILRGGDSNACTIKIDETLTGAKTLNIKINDADKTLDFGGNFTTTGAWSQTGAHSLAWTTTGATTVTLPTTGTLATLAGGETLSNKTLTAVKIISTDGIFDANGDEFIIFTADSTPITCLNIISGDTGVAPIISAYGETNVHLMLKGVGTGNVQLADGGDITCIVEFELDGATSGKTMTIVHSHTDDRTMTVPDATDTFVGKATTDTLTNKSIAADGTGNVITNINMAEMDAETIPPNDGSNVTIVDGLIMAKVTNNGTFFNIFDSNAPYAFMVIDAWSINISADGGTWALNDTAGGGGTTITNTVTVDANDKDIDRATEIDDVAAQIAASGDLSINFDGGGALDAYIFIKIARLS